MNQGKIKSIVETAIRMLDEGGWNPSQGGGWQSKHVDLRVEFNKPTRFCVKASYRVVGGAIGVWTGYLKEKIYLYAPKEIFCIDYYEQALKSLKLLKAN